jgi:uncharacterized membrane protein
VTDGSLWTAARIVLPAPRLWALGLAGFLARGGIVLFALPIIVLPSVVGLTTFIGPNSVSAAGLTARFVALVAVTIAVLIAWIVLATLVGAAVDRAIVRAVLPNAGRAATNDAAGETGLASLFVVRLVSLAPFAIGVALGGLRLGQVGYDELILPSDSTTPFVLRVLRGAPEVVAVLVLTWLASELIGAVAVRVAIVEQRSALPSLGTALGWIARRPLRAFGFLLVTVLISLIVIGPLIVAAAALWTAVQRVLLDDPDPVAGLAVVTLLLVVWAAGLTLSGMVAAWRGVAWSLAVLEDHRGGGPVAVRGGTL